MAIKFSTFNCRGLQDNFKRKKIFSYFHKRNDDIIFLQETHSSLKDEKWWSTQWGGHSWFCSFASNSKGVGILIKSSASVSTNTIIKDPDGRYIILDVLINGFHLILVNVYGPNKDDPDFFIDLFSKLDNMDSSRLVIAGDLNIALGPLDYQGSLSSHSNTNSRNVFNALMDEFNLIDVWRSEHPNSKTYTRHQKNPVALTRLDYIFSSSALINNVKSSNIISGISSDHSIVTAKISTDAPARGRGYWKCNCHYLRHDSVLLSLLSPK
jgi:exonuclease III